MLQGGKPRFCHLEGEQEKGFFSCSQAQDTDLGAELEKQEMAHSSSGKPTRCSVQLSSQTKSVHGMQTPQLWILSPPKSVLTSCVLFYVMAPWPKMFTSILIARAALETIHMSTRRGTNQWTEILSHQGILHSNENAPTPATATTCMSLRNIMLPRRSKTQEVTHWAVQF